MRDIFLTSRGCFWDDFLLASITRLQFPFLHYKCVVFASPINSKGNDSLSWITLAIHCSKYVTKKFLCQPSGIQRYKPVLPTPLSLPLQEKNWPESVLGILTHRDFCVKMFLNITLLINAIFIWSNKRLS